MSMSPTSWICDRCGKRIQSGVKIGFIRIYRRDTYYGGARKPGAMEGGRCPKSPAGTHLWVRY